MLIHCFECDLRFCSILPKNSMSGFFSILSKSMSSRVWLSRLRKKRLQAAQDTIQDYLFAVLTLVTDPSSQLYHSLEIGCFAKAVQCPKPELPKWFETPKQSYIMFWLLCCYYDIIYGDMSSPSRGNSTRVSSFWPPPMKLDRALPVLNRLRLIIIILGTVYISRVLLALTKSLQLLQNHLLSSSKVSTCLNSRKQSSIWTCFDF